MSQCYLVKFTQILFYHLILHLLPHLPDSNIIARSCSEIVCHHGATCQVKNGMATCICPTQCPPASAVQPAVCGTDGQQYGSECQLRMFACRRQVPIMKAYDGPCKGRVVFNSTKLLYQGKGGVFIHPVPHPKSSRP